MNKFWVMTVVLFSTSLGISSLINADSPLMGVEILRGTHSQRRLPVHGIPCSYVWGFEDEEYTVILAINEQWYNRIRNQQHRRRYDHGHFPPMVYEGVKSLGKLIKEFNEIIPRTWSAERKVNFVLAFVQAIPYEDDKTTGYDEYYKYPTETFVERQGDCEDSSMLFAAILSGLGFELALLIPPGHLAVGVKGNFRGGRVLYGNDAYYYCETTHKGWKLGNIPEKYIGIQVEVMPITPNPVRPKQVTPQIITPRPTLPSSPSSQTALKNGIDLFYKARFNEAIKSLQSALDRLSDPERRAEAYIYLGMAESGLGKSIPEIKDRFQKALRENPNQEFDHKKFKDWFDEVHEESIGELTVSASLPQTEIWIYGNGTKRKKLGTGTNPIKVKLFKGGYTVEGIYAGKSNQEVVKIEPEAHTKVHIEIPLADDSPPIIQLVDPPQTANVNQEIAIRAKITDDSVVKVNFYYGFSRYSRSEPARYSEGTIIHIKTSDIYTGIISSQNKVGYIWYYLTATDREGNKAETQKRVLEIKIRLKYTPSENQPPRIELIGTIQTAKVNQRISVKAKVTDDKAVRSVYLFYSFSHSNISPPEEYNWKKLTGNPLGIYSGYIPAQNEEGYIWYYIGATDNEGEDEESEKERLRVKRDEPYSPPQPKDKPSITVLNQTSVYQGIWANYAWPSEVFEDGGPIFDSNRGDAINFTYLREGRTYQTLGVQLDYSYQNPSNMSATFQWGPSLGKSPITFTLLTGIAGYRKPDFTRTTSTLTTDVSDESIYITPILGVGLKYYPLDRVAIDATGSFKLPSTFDATSLYHYEVGSRIYITDALNLKIGYSQWYLGSQNIARIQVGLGITF